MKQLDGNPASKDWRLFWRGLDLCQYHDHPTGGVNCRGEQVKVDGAPQKDSRTLGAQDDGSGGGMAGPDGLILSKFLSQRGGFTEKRENMHKIRETEIAVTNTETSRHTYINRGNAKPWLLSSWWCRREAGKNFQARSASNESALSTRKSIGNKMAQGYIFISI